MAKDRLQLPPTSSAKYRIEFDVKQVKDKMGMPYGMHDEGTCLELLCRDYLGIGGNSQILIENTEIHIKSIWDISGVKPIRIK